MSAKSPDHFHKKRIAVLIDAENVSFKLVDEIFEEVALLGQVTHRRVYGDFSIPQLSGWNGVANDFALRQVMQRHNANGKNSSDIVLVIDAMDILHSREVDAICIVSHDSDFTRLAMRIAESGVEVIGMGERKKVGASFKNACSDFRYIEDKNNGVAVPSLPRMQNAEGKGAALEMPPPAAASSPKKIAADKTQDAAQPSVDAAPVAAQSAKLTRKNVALFVKRALAEHTEEWLNIGHLGNLLRNRWPDFDPRPLYPHSVEATSKQLGAFLKTLPDFETKDGRLRLNPIAAAPKPAPQPPPSAP